MLNALAFGLFFILAFAAFGVLAGGMIALPFALISHGAYMVATYAIAAIIAFRIARSAMEIS